MSADPSLDAVLVEWGDRLFYPGNRIVKAHTPRLHWGTSRAKVIRHRIEATVRRAHRAAALAGRLGRGLVCDPHLGQGVQEVLRLDARVVREEQLQRVTVRSLTFRQLLEPAAPLLHRQIERLVQQRRDHRPVLCVDLHHASAVRDSARRCVGRECRTSAMPFERVGRADADIAEIRFSSRPSARAT